MRVVVFGLPLAALLLAEDGHDVALVASPRSDALGMRRARRVFGERFRVRPPLDAALHAKVRALAPELFVSWFWTTKLPMSLVSLAKQGGLGVHPSLLPRHRGPDPYFWAIERGDRETGVTAHRLAAEYDTGAILGQRKLAIDPSWNAWTLAKKLDRPSLALLRETVRAFAEGHPPRETPQDESLATTAPEPDEELLALRFDRPTDAVLRRIRALAPSPGASFELEGNVVVVTRADAATRWPKALVAGEAAVVDGKAVVRTGDAAIVLLEGEDEEGRRLASGDLARLARGEPNG